MKKKSGVDPKLKKLVLASLRKHSWNLGVSNYKGDVLYMEEDLPEKEESMVNACIIVNRRYLHFTIQIFPYFIKNWKERGDEFADAVIAHEVAHVVTQHLYDMATSVYKDEGEVQDAWESLTETVGRLSCQIRR